MTFASLYRLLLFRICTIRALSENASVESVFLEGIVFVEVVHSLLETNSLLQFSR